MLTHVLFRRLVVIITPLFALTTFPNEGCSSVFIQTYFSLWIYWNPDKQSSCGFMNLVSKQLHTLTGVEQRITSTYHPQSNKLVERQNCLIKKCKSISWMKIHIIDQKLLETLSLLITWVNIRQRSVFHFFTVWPWLSFINRCKVQFIRTKIRSQRWTL